VKRRDLLALIGAAAGSTVMYQAMTSLGHAAESGYGGPIKLDGNVKGASVLILGAGLAGLVAAYELRKAGYQVKVLEYGARAGGRSWSIRGGDRVTELGGATQECGFDRGLYLNPGPWRIPYHHGGFIDYCRRFNVPLEAFVQLNYNAYLHSKDAFGGKPQRYRHISSDFSGGVAELLGKAVDAGKLDDAVTKEDKEKLLEALRQWGALDKSFAYKADDASDRRGYEKDAGGGPDGAPTPSTPLTLSDVLKSGLWQGLSQAGRYEFQTTMFQPVGGMDRLAHALTQEVRALVRFNAKVTAIRQDEKGVTVRYVDTKTNAAAQETAQWCLCTIPLSILRQIEMNVGPKMATAIGAVPYVPSVKVGLQMKRRFWEEDEAIYGGITVTDLPIRNIGYPNSGFGTKGKGVLLGTYAIFQTFALEFGALDPAQRVAKAVEWGAQIHPQYRTEFENGVAVAWQRNPASLGCFANWTDDLRKAHYADLCAIDGRILLAGEHASYIPAWQEGAILSSLSAIERLHARVVTG